jgi:hypothetical protein
VWNEEVFNATKLVYMGWGLFFREVAQEIGTQRTLDLLITMDRKSKAPQIQQLGESDEIDLKARAAGQTHLWEMLGFDTTIEATDTSLITTTPKCPFYEGFLEAGIDHNTIEAFCRGKDDAGDTQYKQLVGPHAGLKMRKFRSGPDDYCIEETILKPSED